MCVHIIVYKNVNCYGTQSQNSSCNLSSYFYMHLSLRTCWVGGLAPAVFIFFNLDIVGFLKDWVRKGMGGGSPSSSYQDV